jgi:hypothetical protein
MAFSEVEEETIVDVPYPVAADKGIDIGDTVVTTGGFAQAGDLGPDLKVKGVALSKADNTGGAAGDKHVVVMRPISRHGGERVFERENAGDIEQKHVGEDCYIAGAKSVSADKAGKSMAGEIIAITAAGKVVVKFRV